MQRATTGWLRAVMAGLPLTGCSAQPTGLAVTPRGQEVPPSTRVLAGTLVGSQVGPTARVALVGYFANSAGQKLDALGAPASEDVVVSVPAKDGRYGIALPVPPSGPGNAPSPAVRGRFGLLVFNDANGNQRPDPAEAAYVVPETEVAVNYQPFAGYTIQRNNITSTDPTYFDRVNLTFN
ncbi:MAG: hypothetical protein H7338_19285 [Candidatus Sericytochromatia bacterium]|nr:hypothetical protein [Candidatus Sericytochromatia bacterium]